MRLRGLQAAANSGREVAEPQRLAPPRRAVAASAAKRGGSSTAGDSDPATTSGRRAASVKEVAVLGGADWLYSQKSGVAEDLFKGDVLGVDADVASTDFRVSELRSLSHLPRGFAPPARFLDAFALHLAKNALAGSGGLPRSVPLILGVWGHKVRRYRHSV